ncbi:MAG: UbiX family flavin prenyltransferase [Bryobacterales bacterium]|nr:UbiX family flavin prenyltransferase [Bryobacterales bacterium]
MRKVYLMKVVLAITGASGSIYGVRLARQLANDPRVELHLVLSRAGERTLFEETGIRAQELRDLASFSYPFEDIGCRLASGSYQTDAMVVAPCSIQTMSAIAHGISSNLITRAADVMLKERRKLVLMVRESPFHLGHLRSMVALSEMGAIIAPPVPGFYHKPETVLDLVDHSIHRVLDLIGCPDANARRWDVEGGGRRMGRSISGTDESSRSQPGEGAAGNDDLHLGAGDDDQ